MARALGLLSFGALNMRSIPAPADVSEAQTRPPSLQQMTLTCSRNELMEV